MFTIEIMLVAAFILSSLIVYALYRHLQDQLDCANSSMQDLIEAHNKASFQLKQQLKDGLQSNSICCRSATDSCKSAIDKVNSRIAIIEKNQTGSIKVVRRETPKKENK